MTRMTRITSMTELRQSMILFFRVIVCAAFLLMMAELLSSCEHKDLCYDHPHRQNVEVMFDWSADPDANPATMSLYLYPEEGGDPIRYEFTDKNGGNISVAAGTYRAICVNSDKETHRILGKERFETFQVTSAETRALQGLLATMAGAAPMGRGTEKERMMQQPEMLWSGHETTHLLEGLNHIILILDNRLAVIHLIAARCQRHESEQTIY